MNRIRTILAVLFISLFAYPFASGQEKKDEQKIKVIIADKSGTKVVIDTTFTGDSKNDSILLKSGKVIYIGQNKSDIDDGPGSRIEVIAHVDSDGKNTEHKYIYINDDGKVIRHSDDKTFDVIVSDDVLDSNLDKTSYVIAKNGITVTVEGSDEDKIKELVEEIEKKLEMTEKGSDKDPAVKKIKNRE